MLKTIRITIFSVLVAMIIALSFTAGFGVGRGGALSSPRLMAFNAAEPTNPGDLPRQFKLLGEVWNILKQDFVDEKALDPDKLGTAAIEGVLSALGDPHTSYITPEQYNSEQMSFKGSYEGIGAHVTIKDDQLTVVAPIAGSPAEEAGIRVGDKILEVEGESTAKMSLAEAVEKIKGPRGSKVKLSILHEGDSSPVALEIARDVIKTGSVAFRMLPDGIAYLRITHFSQRTGSELASVLKDILNQKPAGIVLDMRNNPGGLLETSLDTASQFLKNGVVAYQVDRKGNREEMRVRPGGLATQGPLAVLVNQNSASGAEIVAGAIQDAGRGPIIGTKTFGKGGVNHLREMSDGSAIYVTIARWLTPKGRTIDVNGLSPDIEVTITQEDATQGRDPQLDRAIDYLKSKSQ